MNPPSSNSLETIKVLSETTIVEATLEVLTPSGDSTLRYTGLMFFKYIPPATASNGSAAPRPMVYLAIPHSSQASMFAENSSQSLTVSRMKYYQSILISSLVWAILLYGLYAAVPGLASYVELRTVLLIVFLVTNSYLLTILRVYLGNGTTARPRS